MNCRDNIDRKIIRRRGKEEKRKGREEEGTRKKLKEEEGKQSVIKRCEKGVKGREWKGNKKK